VSTSVPRRKSWRRRLLLGAVTLVLVFVVVSVFFAYKLTGPRQRAVGPAPADFPFPVHDASWVTGDGQTIKGWFVPASDSDRAIVLLHGFAGDRRQMLSRARLFREAGYNVLLYDARACGESTGDFVTFGYREAQDLVGAVEYLRTKKLQRIACLGVSQGGATILFAAKDLADLRCAVCESAFDELSHAIHNRFHHYVLLPGWLAGCIMIPVAEYRTGLCVDEVRPIEHIAGLACPIMIVSGEQDVKTTPSETRALFERAREPKELWVVPAAGHQDLFGQPQYANKVLAFVEKHMQ
jgi:uncharacterized protein